jgi:hypothetical protein
MNYKTLIAFLGKNQMKDWATPKSDWILVNDRAKNQWLPEAYELGAISEGAISLPTPYGYANLAHGDLTIFSKGSEWPRDCGRDIYYNKDKNFTLSDGRRWPAEKLEQVFEILNEMDLPVKQDTNLKLK